MIKLKNYTPIGNDILLKVAQTSTSPRGILLPNPQQDRIMQVLKTGSLVNDIVPGTWVLVGPMGQGIDIPMKDHEGKTVYTVQTSVHSVIGLYDKEKDEDIVFMAGETQESPDLERVGPQNIIDNPGIEKAPFLKELNTEG